MKILKDETIIDWLNAENQDPLGTLLPDGKTVDIQFSHQSLQIHIDYGCTCKITQDNKGSWLFPCKKHTDKANDFRDGIIIHKNL
jgi:hypothetical protein